MSITQCRWKDKDSSIPDNQRWDTIQQSGSIIGSFTRAKTSVAKYIAALTDYFKKYVVSVPLQRATAGYVARAIVEKRVLTSGAPHCLHTDKGANLCSELQLEGCRSLEIEKTRTLHTTQKEMACSKVTTESLQMSFQNLAQTIQAAKTK